jgi:predicted acylesterase/phospholipase RssA
MSTEKVSRKLRASVVVAAGTEAGIEGKGKGKVIDLALQGGGAHGAFGWGVMDQFLEEGRLSIEGVSGTSAGSMNAVVYAYGKIKGNDGAREALYNFWKAISDAGQLNPGSYNPLREVLESQVVSAVL